MFKQLTRIKFFKHKKLILNNNNNILYYSMFDKLSNGITSAIDKVTSKKKVTKRDIENALGTINQSLISSDVAYPVIKKITRELKNEALGQYAVKGLPKASAIYAILEKMLIGISLFSF